MNCESGTDIGVFARTMAVSHSHDYGVGDHANPHLILAGLTRSPCGSAPMTRSKANAGRRLVSRATRRHWRLGRARLWRRRQRHIDPRPEQPMSGSLERRRLAKLLWTPSECN